MMGKDRAKAQNQASPPGHPKQIKTYRTTVRREAGVGWVIIWRAVMTKVG